MHVPHAYVRHGTETPGFASALQLRVHPNIHFSGIRHASRQHARHIQNAMAELVKVFWAILTSRGIGRDKGNKEAHVQNHLL